MFNFIKFNFQFNFHKNLRDFLRVLCVLRGEIEFLQ